MNVRSDGRNLYPGEQLGETGLTASTLKGILDGLMKKDVCERAEDQYFLVDPLMRHWVERYTAQRLRRLPRASACLPISSPTANALIKFLRKKGLRAPLAA
ncbi:MAG TPA: hypothetical protein ENN39_04330, partial [Desulfonatronum sp.]|nr:hypothetical protein [Desulfonatronum sp.]